MSKAKNIVLWIVSILLGAMFLFSGVFKLLKPEEAKAGFVHYGYAAWFAIFIGVCEVFGSLGLLIPRLAFLAAVNLSIIMVGATYTHFSHHEYQHGMIPLVLLVLLIGVAYTRFKEGKNKGL
jgi:putative oxidoreductase